MKLLTPQQTQAAIDKNADQLLSGKRVLEAEIVKLTKTLDDLKSEYARKSQEFASDFSKLIDKLEQKADNLKTEVKALEKARDKAMEPVHVLRVEAKNKLDEAENLRIETEAWARLEHEKVDKRRKDIGKRIEELLDKKDELDEQEESLTQRKNKIDFYEKYWHDLVEKIKKEYMDFKKRVALEEARLKTKEAELIDRELEAEARTENAKKKEARNRATHIKLVDREERLKLAAEELKKKK